MDEKRVKVWVQRFKDRPTLMLQWIDPDTGRRKSKSAETADLEKAETARADLESDLNHGRYAEVSRITWEAFRERFEEEYVAGTRPDTQRNFEATLNLFERLCNPTRLRSVNERMVSAFVAGLRKDPGRRKGTPNMMPSTIKVRLQFLHTALSWAAEQKMLPAVPKFPAVKVPKKDPQPVPAETFEKLFDKAKDAQMRAYLLCGWLAGLRLREALALEWEPTDKTPWVDFQRNRIVLPAAFVKADKDQWLPLDPELRRALEALPRTGRRVFRFVDREGSVLDRGGVSQRVAALAKRAGVKLTMKCLRRGFGCRYAGRVSTHVLQRLMRHANIKTTMAFYANIDDAVEEAVLRAKRNTSRNSRPDAQPAQANLDGVSPYPDSASSRSTG
jgi:integrase